MIAKAHNGVPPESELFYDELIRSYIHSPRYVERNWLWQRVQAALSQPQCRFVLLTAEPGAGKTAFMAWLADKHPNWPRYFIRRDQHTPLEDGGARGFLEKIGFQLAARFPEAFQTDAVRLSVSQVVGQVESSGQVIGADVNTLIASPFYKKTIDIIQDIKRQEGSVTGIRVHELVTDPNRISLLDLQRMALLAPALALKKQSYNEPIVIMIDALDELRYRALGDTVLDWLTQCPELPTNVRILVTSRPDREWLAAFRSAQRDRLVEETIPEVGEDIRKDLTEYAGKLSTIAEVESFLVAHKQPEQLAEEARDQFVATAVGKAKGNLGYLDALCRAIVQAIGSNDQALLQGLLELRQLPDTLLSLYGHFLNLLCQSVGQRDVIVEDPENHKQSLINAWINVYRPIISVLAVAMEPLTPFLIRRLGRVLAGEDDVFEAVGRLRQFLDEEGGRYTFYHATLPEFLTAEATRENPETASLHVDAQRAHCQIADHYVSEYSADWLACSDRYALAHTPAHLTEAARQASQSGEQQRLRKELVCLLTSVQFLEAAARVVGVENILGSVHRALSVVPPGTPLLQLARVLGRERHLLSARDLDQLPAFFAQQILNRGRDEGATELAGAALDRLAALGQPHLELRWRTRRQSPALITTLVGHEGGVSGVAITADGGSVISGSTDGTLRVWSLQAGQEARILVSTYPVVALALAVRRQQLVAATQRWSRWNIEVRDASTGALAGTLVEEQEGKVTALVLTPDGKQVVAGFDNGHVRSWNLSTREQMFDVRGHDDSVLTVVVTPDGARAVTGSADLSIKVWDLRTGSFIGELPNNQERITKLAVTPDGDRIACGTHRGQLTVWDLGTCAEVSRFAGHDKSVSALVVTPDGSRVISGSEDATLKVWNIETGSLLGTLTGHQWTVRAVAITDDGKLLLSGSEDGTLALWDLEAACTAFVPTGHEAQVTSVALASGSPFVVSVSNDGAMKFLALKDGSEIGTSIIAKAGRTVVVRPWTPAAVTCSADGTVRWWDLASGKGRLEMELPGPATAIAVDPGGFVVSSDGTVTRRDFDGDDYEYNLSSKDSVIGINSLAMIPPDGLRVGYAGYRQPENAGETGVLNLQTGEHDWLGYNENCNHNVVVVTGDGRYLISGCERGLIRIWDLRTNEELPSLAETDDVLSATIHQNAERLVVGLFDRRVVVRNLSGFKVEAAAAVEAPVTAVDVDQGSNLIVVGDASGNLYCYAFVEGGHRSRSPRRHRQPARSRARRHASKP